MSVHVYEYVYACVCFTVTSLNALKQVAYNVMILLASFDLLSVKMPFLLISLSGVSKFVISVV